MHGSLQLLNIHILTMKSETTNVSKMEKRRIFYVIYSVETKYDQYYSTFLSV